VRELRVVPTDLDVLFSAVSYGYRPLADRQHDAPLTGEGLHLFHPHFEGGLYIPTSI